MYREMSFISYYFHWGMDEVLAIDHKSRRRWCREISEINEKLNPSKDNKEKSIFECKKPHSSPGCCLFPFHWALLGFA